MAKGKKITINDMTFNSLTDVAIFFNLSPATLARRLRGGWTIEQAIGKDEKPKRIGNAKRIEFNGVQYLNLKELAKVNNKHPEMLRRKLREGYSLQEIISNEVKRKAHANAKPIAFNKKLYPSIHALVDEFKIKASVYSKRLKRGWTIEQALEMEPAPPRFRNFEGHAREVKWKNVQNTPRGIEPIPDSDGYKLYVIKNKKNSKQYVGITIGSLDQRLKQHFSSTRRGRKGALQNAIRFYGEINFFIELISSTARNFSELQDMEIKEIIRRDSIKNGYNTAHGGSLGTSKPITVDGNVFPSFAQAAQHYGVDTSVFSLRITRLKWSPEEAVGLIARNWSGKSKVIEIDGVNFSSIRQAALQFHIKPELAYGRIEMGWTPKQALGLEDPPETLKYTGKEIHLFGKTYKSIAAAAKDQGISAEPFRLRLLRGLSPEEAYKAARKK